MKVNLYAILDSASGVYDGPVPGQADGVMMRHFTDYVNDPEHPIGKHPDCYTLFKVGTWNDGTAEVEPCTPERLANGVSLLRGNNGENE